MAQGGERRPPTAKWEPSANEDLLRPGTEPADAPARDGGLNAATRWFEKLPRRLTRIAVALIAGILIASYMAGGVDGLAATLLSKRTGHYLPGAGTLRVWAASIIERRPVVRETSMPLVRLVHTLDPEDPIRASVIRSATRLLAIPDVRPNDPPATSASIDAAAARALRLPLGPDGVLAWQPLDPYFVIWLDEMAGTDAPAAANRFNTLRPPEGLPTAEWYIDDVGVAFGDTRPFAFVLVADSTGDDWRPKALAPDAVPAHARRIAVTTIGEALRVGLWGDDRYRPDTPDTDVAGWWRRTAEAHGLPTYVRYADEQ